jgi:hypothetical protein
MVSIREPILHPVSIAELHPTQMTVGMREVAAKRKAWRTKGRSHRKSRVRKSSVNR